MSNLIYQYYQGNVTTGVWAGVKLMKAYAERIGAEYIFDNNQGWMPSWYGEQYCAYYGAFRPVFDTEFDKYDNILFADCDIIPVDGLTDNIFDEMDDHDLLLAEEWNQPEARAKYNIGGITGAKDNQWAKWVKDRYGVDVPRTESGKVRVFNSGVVLYSKEGRKNLREAVSNASGNFQESVAMYLSGVAGAFPNFYTLDQNYLNVVMCGVNWGLLDYKWNSSVSYVPETQDPRPVLDLRTKDTKFVHVQIRGKGDFPIWKMQKIADKPVGEWNL